MKYRFGWLIGIFLVCRIFLASAPARAQGAYTTEWTEGDELYTEVEGYDDGGCSGDVVWSNLVGADGTEYSGEDIIQWLLANPGTEYTWNLGGTVYFDVPLYGCDSDQWSLTETVSLHITFYQTPYENSVGGCGYHNLACSMNTTPTCTGGLIPSEFVYPFCPPYIVATYLLTSYDGENSECTLSIVDTADGPGACN